MEPANHGPGVVDAFDVHDQMATTFGGDASEWRDYTALDRETKVPLDYALGDLASLARRYDIIIDAEEEEEEEEVEEVLLYLDEQG